MNESLAKQLHDLIISYKITINHAVREELDDLENDVKRLIENETYEEKND